MLRVHVQACRVKRHSRLQLTMVSVELIDKRNSHKKQLKEFKRIPELEELSNKSILNDYDEFQLLLLKNKGRFHAKTKLTTY